MSRLFPLSSFLFVAALCSATPVVAQQRSAVSGSELDAAVAGRPIGSRPAVPGVHAVGTPAPNQAAAQQSLAQSQNGERDLAGGAVTIGWTVLIIALLVVVILVIA